jgi:hypothetical protein
MKPGSDLINHHCSHIFTAGQTTSSFTIEYQQSNLPEKCLRPDACCSCRIILRYPTIDNH